MGTASDESSDNRTDSDPVTALANAISAGTLSTPTAELLALQTVSAARAQDLSSGTVPGINLIIATDAGVNMSRVVTRMLDVLPDGARVNGSQASRSGILGSATNGEIQHGPVLDPETPFTAIEAVEKLSENKQAVFREILETNSFTFTTKHVNETVPSPGSLLFTSRPENGVFDPYEPYGEQLELSAELRNAADLLVIEPITEAPIDQPPVTPVPVDTAQQLLDRAARATPVWSSAAETSLPDVAASLHVQSITDPEEYQWLPTHERVTTTIRKLAEAHACLRGGDTVAPGDVTTVSTLLETTLPKVIDEEARDRDELVRNADSVVATPDDQDELKSLKDIVSDLEDRADSGAPIPAVHDEAVKEGYAQEDLPDLLEELRMKGEVYEPADNHLRAT